MSYDIDVDITVGDPEHVAHHVNLGAAVNDLDSRTTVLEESGGGGGSAGRTVLGVWNSDTLVSEPDGTTPGMAYWTMTGDIASLIFTLVDNEGTDFEMLAYVMPPHSRVRITSTANQNDWMLFELGGDNFSVFGMYAANNGMLIDSTEDVFATPQEVALVFEVTPTVAPTPTLDEVLDEGNTSGTAIVLQVGDVRSIIDIGSYAAQDSAGLVSASITPGQIYVTDDGEESPEWGQIAISPAQIIFVQQSESETVFAWLKRPETITEDRTWQMPDRSGEVAVGPAGLDTVGWGRAVYIASGGTVPIGTPEYTQVFEEA